MAKTYTGTVGLILDLDCGADVSTATVHTIEVELPDETTTSWAAILHPTNVNYIRYVTVANDLSQAGIHYLQPHIEMPTPFSGRGDTVRFEVFDEYE